MKKIYNFTNIAPHYRKNLIEKLLNANNFEFYYFFGKNKNLKIKEIDFYDDKLYSFKGNIGKLKNIWINQNILVWQTGVISRCLKNNFDIAFFLGEFQIISNWFAMLICKIRGIKVVYWTHGLYGNESFFIKKLRLTFYNTADSILVYEKRAKDLLIKYGISSNKLNIIYNSLNYDKHLSIRNKIHTTNKKTPLLKFKINNLPYIVFIGRLTKIKKIDLLIKALHLINFASKKLNLLIIGDGDEKQKLQSLAFKLDIIDYIQFYGHCYDEKILANLIYNSCLCVSPGNIGLAAIHSMSFGTPVCTHNNFFNQMPEADVIKEGETGTFFKENDFNDLADKICLWLDNPLSRENIKKNCFKVIDTNYNPYFQLKIISNLVSSL